MRAAIVLAVLLVAIPRADADGPAAELVGFDHHLHDRDVDVSGASEIPCARCHPTKAGRLVGRPDHAACFGTCHGPPPPRGARGVQALSPERLRLCTNCHTTAALGARAGRPVPVTYPPYVATDFMLAAGHKAHRDVSCTDCHVSRRGPAHKRCLGCHDGTGRAGHGPPMTACAGCHTPGSGAPEPPRLAPPQNTVTATFSHAQHARRGTPGAECVTCHAEIRDTDDSILPRPTAASCATAGCHDGAAAFSITAACTTCHTRAPEGRYDVNRSTPRFDHARPEHTQQPCAACHPLTPTGEVVVAGHAPCAACHAADFGKREPRICRACHNSTDPWRKLAADRIPPPSTEFGSTLPHLAHEAACRTCHSLRTVYAQLRPPRGHTACTGPACHAIQGGPTPQLGACERCHQRGLATQRLAARAAAPWSTRTTFDHARHGRDQDGGELACVTCHDDLSSSTVLGLATPAKRTCAPCHDGGRAFKLTGTGCMRCHPGARP